VVIIIIISGEDGLGLELGNILILSYRHDNENHSNQYRQIFLIRTKILWWSIFVIIITNLKDLHTLVGMFLPKVTHLLDQPPSVLV